MLCVAPAYGGMFSVTPVRIYMSPKDKAVAVTINNEGDEELVMQADVYLWKQKPSGEDDLTLTEDLLLSPPIIKVAGKSRQVIRLARLQRSNSEQQLTYRMVVREIPEAKPNKENVQFQFALAFSMPVFITPPSAKHILNCTIERSSASSVNAVCENSGNAYAQPLNFLLTSESGITLASRDGGGYILPSVKRHFDLKPTESNFTGGKATLTVKLDDGTNQSFDVTIAE